MFERILNLGVSGRRQQKLPVKQVSQRRSQIRRIHLEGLPKHRLGKRLPDNRCRLQYALFPVGQPVDAGVQRRLHRRRHVDTRNRGGRPVVTSLALEHVGFDQLLEDLLCEKRIPRTALKN